MKRSIGLVCLFTGVLLFTFPLWGDYFWYGVGYVVENCTKYWIDVLSPQESAAATTAQPIATTAQAIAETTQPTVAPAVAPTEPVSAWVRINGASRRIYVGMTLDECIKVCGLPYRVNKVVSQLGTSEQVTFNEPFLHQPILYFEDGTLTLWQE